MAKYIKMVDIARKIEKDTISKQIKKEYINDKKSVRPKLFNFFKWIFVNLLIFSPIIAAIIAIPILVL